MLLPEKFTFLYVFIFKQNKSHIYDVLYFVNLLEVYLLSLKMVGVVKGTIICNIKSQIFYSCFQSFTTAHKTDPNEVIKKSQYFDTHDKIKAHIEEKHHYQNFRRYLQVQRQECEDYDQLHKRLEAAALLEKRMYRDNKLASELDKLKRPEIRDAKLR